MAMRIGLMCLLCAAGTVAQCGPGSWYESSRMFVDETPSAEERIPSYEEVSNEYYPQQQERYGRSSRYSPSYSYGNELQQDSGDWERYASGPTRKPPRQEAPKSRRTYGTYGKSSRTRSYSYKSSPDMHGYGRKKTNRAASAYRADEGVHYGKATSVTFKAVPPKPNCARNLLIGCTPTVTRVPCSASLQHGRYGPELAPHYPHPPMYHHAPLVHYPPPYPAYHPHSGGYYPPPPPSVYPKPTASGAHPKPTGPSYKAAPDEEDVIPGFPAPVQENLGETTRQPVISAFSKPSSDATATLGVPGPSTTVTMTTTTTMATAATVNGTGELEKSAGPANPMPLLTTTTEPYENNDEFWAVESNIESSTDAVAVSAVR